MVKNHTTKIVVKVQSHFYRISYNHSHKKVLQHRGVQTQTPFSERIPPMRRAVVQGGKGQRVGYNRPPCPRPSRAPQIERIDCGRHAVKARVEDWLGRPETKGKNEIGAVKRWRGSTKLYLQGNGAARSPRACRERLQSLLVHDHSTACISAALPSCEYNGWS